MSAHDIKIKRRAMFGIEITRVLVQHLFKRHVPIVHADIISGTTPPAGPDHELKGLLLNGARFRLIYSKAIIDGFDTTVHTETIFTARIYFDVLANGGLKDFGHHFNCTIENGIVRINHVDTHQQFGWIVHVTPPNQDGHSNYPQIELMPIWEDDDHPLRLKNVFVERRAENELWVQYKMLPGNNLLFEMKIDDIKSRRASVRDSFCAFSKKADANAWAAEMLVELGT